MVGEQARKRAAASGPGLDKCTEDLGVRVGGDVLSVGVRNSVQDGFALLDRKSLLREAYDASRERQRGALGSNAENSL